MHSHSRLTVSPGPLAVTLRAAALSSALLISPACAHADRWASLCDSTLVVFVSSSYDARPLNGVRVFVLSVSGRTLVQGTTHTNGFVRLRIPSSRNMPAFVLAEEPNHFVGGSRWEPERCEYLIALAPGAVM